MAPPKTSVDYPANFAEFASWFTTDADCLDYLSEGGGGLVGEFDDH